MKKILIIGDFNDSVADIDSFLGTHFDTQLCTVSGKIVKSMLKMYTPDVVLIATEKYTDVIDEIFDSISEYDAALPVITIKCPVSKYSNHQIFTSGQAKNLESSLCEEVLKSICTELKMDADILLQDACATEKKHVIVVDDNAVLLRNMRNMLQERYRVSLATSATQCMRIMGQEKPDLIILDYEMPVVDGKQTLEMIRAEDEYKEVPVIFLTGIADKEHVDAVLDLKPAGYFVKPPIQSKIFAALDKIFDSDK